jgi:hypothetical protein
MIKKDLSDFRQSEALYNLTGLNLSAVLPTVLANVTRSDL